MDFKKEELLVILIAVILFLGFIIFVKPSITANVTYSPSNYIYNSSLVNFSNNEIKLIPVITTQTTVTNNQSTLHVTAANDEEDRLDKVNSLGNGDALINVNKNLSITLSNNLENNDIVSMYLTHNKITNVKLCSLTGCSTQYSTASYSGSPSWVNFTISNLNSPDNKFIIIPESENIKVDYSYAAHFSTITNTTATISYPLQATIETPDIQPENISKFDYVNYTVTLNNQRTDFQYSINSGSSWINLSEKNISSLNSTKIKIRAILYSDSSDTPVINSLSLLYSEIIPSNENNAIQNQSTETPVQTESGSSSSSSSSSGNSRAPSSRVQAQENKIVQNIPVKEEQKEIKLFEDPKNIENKKEASQEIITAQAVKDIQPVNYISVYSFVALIFVLYLVYHRHVKKASSNKTKKFKKR